MPFLSLSKSNISSTSSQTQNKQLTNENSNDNLQQSKKEEELKSTGLFFKDKNLKKSSHMSSLNEDLDVSPNSNPQSVNCFSGRQSQIRKNAHKKQKVKQTQQKPVSIFQQNSKIQKVQNQIININNNSGVTSNKDRNKSKLEHIRAINGKQQLNFNILTEERKELKIAEEKKGKGSKQAIVETPKFSEYYSMLAKNSLLPFSSQVLRSKSLVKNNLFNEVKQNSAQLNSQKDLQNVRYVKKDGEIIKIASLSSCLQQSTNEQKLSILINNQESTNKKQCSTNSFQSSISHKGLIKLKKADIKFSGQSQQPNKMSEQKLSNCNSFKNNHTNRGSFKEENSNYQSNKNGLLNFDMNQFQVLQSPRIQQKQQQVNVPDSPTTASEDEEKFEIIQSHSVDDFNKVQQQDEEDKCVQSRNSEFSIQNESENRISRLKEIPMFEPKQTLKVKNEAVNHQKKKLFQIQSKQKSQPYQYIGVLSNSNKLVMDSPEQEALLSKPNQFLSNDRLLGGTVNSVLTTFREIQNQVRNFGSSDKTQQNMSYTKAKNELSILNTVQDEESKQEADQTIKISQENKNQMTLLTINGDQMDTIEMAESQLENNMINQKEMHIQRSKFQKRETLNTKNTINEEISPNNNKKSSRLELDQNLLCQYLDIDQNLFSQSLQEGEVLEKLFQKFDWLEGVCEFLLEKYQVRNRVKEQKGYFTYLSKKNSKYDFEIEKDIERTFPQDFSFQKGQENYTKLFKILRVVALHLPDIGYVQGFNFIAGSLLRIFANEENVFWLFIGILNNQQIKLHQVYSENMSGLKLLAFQLHSFIQNLQPEIDRYLIEQSISVEYIASQWIITLFSYDFNTDFFLIVLTLMSVYGKKIIIQVCLSLIEELKEELLNLNMEQALVFLKEFIRENTIETYTILTRAVQYSQVTSNLMKQLEHLYNKGKMKRVLFVKDQDIERTIIKILPNLPDEEEEQVTECNVEQDSFEENSLKKSGKRKINNSFYLNNVSGFDIKFEDINEDFDQLNENMFQEDKNNYLNQISQTERNTTRIQKDQKQQQNLTKKQSETSINKIYESFQTQKSQSKLQDMSSARFKKEISDDLECLEEEEELFDKSQRESCINQFQKKKKSTKEKVQLSQVQKKFNSILSSDENVMSPFRQQFMYKDSQIKTPSNRNVHQTQYLFNRKNSVQESNQTKSNKSKFKIIKKQNHCSQEEEVFFQMSEEQIQDQTMLSHNVSNVEEFMNDIQFNNQQNMLQLSQRVTFRNNNQKNNNENIYSGRDTQKFSTIWKQKQLDSSRTRPMSKDLQLQFEIKEQGSHLNTPINQQTNRSTTILQEKKIPQQIKSIELKKSQKFNSLVSISENVDPNQVSSTKAQINSQSMNRSNTNSKNSVKCNQVKVKSQISSNLPPQNTNTSKLFTINLEQKSRQFKLEQNNFQLFSQNQSLFSKQSQQSQSKKRASKINKIVHNWSANQEFLNKDIHQIGELGRSPQRVKSKLALNKNFSRSSNLCSPKGGGQQKQQSKKICIHQGDDQMLYEESEVTTILTPQDSFIMGGGRQSIAQGNKKSN